MEDSGNPEETDTTKNEDTKKYYCYWIQSGAKCYYGATVDPKRRLRQHNTELCGGSRRTRGQLWTYHCVVGGFQEWTQALQFEWRIKYDSRGCRGIKSREVALANLMKRERWTKNSPLSSEVPLTIEYNPTCYGFPPDKLPSPKIKKVISKTDTPNLMEKKKRAYKRKLHGVHY